MTAFDFRPAQRYHRPATLLLATESMRALGEMAFAAAVMPLTAGNLPAGDGHGVLVLPGFGGSNSSTGILRRALRLLGYDAQGWGGGRNLGPSPAVVSELLANLGALEDKTGRKVSVLGWSLGGIYARLLAEKRPDSVRVVITMGTPFRATDLADTHAGFLYRAMGLLQRNQPGSLDYPIGYRGPIPVPSTSIFSKADGIVPWRACIDERDSLHENVEVLGSHIGLGHHPGALAIIADRLSQPEGVWAHYEPSGVARGLTRTWTTLPQ